MDLDTRPTGESVEVDAISSPTLRAIVADTIDKYVGWLVGAGRSPSPPGEWSETSNSSGPFHDKDAAPHRSG